MRLKYTNKDPSTLVRHTTRALPSTMFQDVIVVLASCELGRGAKVPEESSEVRYNLISFLCKTQVFLIFIFSNYLNIFHSYLVHALVA